MASTAAAAMPSAIIGMPDDFFPGGAAGGDVVSTVASVSIPHAARSASANCTQPLKRCSGSLLRARNSTASSAGGSFGFTVLGVSGWSLTILNITVVGDSPSKGLLPASSW